MTIRFRALADAANLDDFVDGLTDSASVRDRLSGDFEAGTVRPAWCWAAYDGARIVARHHWWGPVGADAPIVLAPLDAPDEDLDAAIALVKRARAAVGTREAWSEITLPADEPGDPWGVRAQRVQVLEQTGFRFAVDRVRVEWLGDSDLPRLTGVLTFRPASSLPHDAVTALFADVADESLDHGMVEDRERLGRDGEAAKRLSFNLAYPGVDDRFVVGVDSSGDDVGYVIPAVQGELGVIAEIGAARKHRGRGYVNELLAHGVSVLVEAGVRRIVADTDCANAPMRAAFARAHFAEFARRWDWGWRG